LVNVGDVQALEAKVAEVIEGDIPSESLLSASYQRRNAALAFAALQQVCPALDEAAVLRKFVDARLLGRFWQVTDRIYADIAHNAEKVGALAAEIENRFPADDKILIVGASSQRVPKDVFAALASVARFIIITGASFKGQDPNVVQQQIREVAKETPSLVIADPRHALQTAKSMQTELDIIVLTGSTYMIEQVLNPDDYMRYLNSSFGWRMEERSEAKGTVQLVMPAGPPPLR
jgi:folylpolyglutamate synthase/dihydropteroate synthase